MGHGRISRKRRKVTEGRFGLRRHVVGIQSPVSLIESRTTLDGFPGSSEKMTTMIMSTVHQVDRIVDTVIVLYPLGSCTWTERAADATMSP